MTVAIDTSALVAVVSGEPDAQSIAGILTRHAGDLVISAATVVEASIVVESSQGPEATADLRLLLAILQVEVVPFDEAQALAAVAAWQRFGKGRHPASLNLGHCHAYAPARTVGADLLFKGDDFTQTDVRQAT